MTGFSLKQIGLTNLHPAGGVDSLSIAIIGISVVFAGLLLIFVSITLLPKILNRRAPKKTTASGNSQRKLEKSGDMDHDMLTAVAVAVHLEVSSQATNQRVTWERPARPGGFWPSSGRLLQMNERVNHFSRSRQV